MNICIGIWKYTYEYCVGIRYWNGENFLVCIMDNIFLVNIITILYYNKQRETYISKFAHISEMGCKWVKVRKWDVNG